MTGIAPSRVPPTLSIMVPTSCDGPRIDGNLVTLDRALAATGEPDESIVVSDGNVGNTCSDIPCSSHSVAPRTTAAVRSVA
jgi:hypothetical protein